MPVIIKKGSKRDKKTMYTWIGCVAMLMFVVSLMVSMGSEGDEYIPNMAAMGARSYDLAQLPFTTDLAESQLLKRKEYSDIAKNPATEKDGLLYSEEERKEREASDLAIGGAQNFPSADPEYAAARAQVKTRGATNYRVPASSRTTASLGTLRAGQTASGGGRGFNSTTWRPGSTGGGTSYTYRGLNANQTSGGMSSADAAALARAKKGRTGFYEAALGSIGAGNAKNDEDGMRKAMEAFQGGKSIADLNTDLEDMLGDMENVGLEGDMGAIADAPSESDLEKADKSIDRKTPQTPYECKGWETKECRNQWWLQLAGNIAEGAINKAIGYGLDAAFGKNKPAVPQDHYMVQMAKFCNDYPYNYYCGGGGPSSTMDPKSPHFIGPPAP